MRRQAPLQPRQRFVILYVNEIDILLLTSIICHISLDQGWSCEKEFIIVPR